MLPRLAMAQPDTSRVVLADRALVFDTNLGLIQRATEEAIDRALTGLKLPDNSEIRLFSVTARDGDWFVEDRIAHYLSSRGYKVYLVEKPKPGSLGGATTQPGGAALSMGAALNATAGSGAPNTSTSNDSTGSTPDSTATDPDQEPPADEPPPHTSGPPNRPTGPRNAPGVQAADQPIETMNEFPEDIEGLVLSVRVLEFAVTYHDQWRQGFMGQRVVERLAAVDLNCRLVQGSQKSILWVGNGRSEKLDIVPKSKLDLLEGRSYPFGKPSLPPQSLSRIVEPALVLGIVAGLVFLFYSNQN
ncbi:MAG TPA: hypothetical protein VF720_12905 [Candidatus Eisenbacteria bacterium]